MRNATQALQGTMTTTGRADRHAFSKQQVRQNHAHHQGLGSGSTSIRNVFYVLFNVCPRRHCLPQHRKYHPGMSTKSNTCIHVSISNSKRTSRRAKTTGARVWGAKIDSFPDPGIVYRGHPEGDLQHTHRLTKSELGNAPEEPSTGRSANASGHQPRACFAVFLNGVDSLALSSRKPHQNT